LVLVSLIVIAPMQSASALPVASGGYRFAFKGPEQCLMKKINRARARRGLSGLSWDKQLGFVARRHAKSIASSRSVYDDGNLGREVTRWRSLGQNTGRSCGCRRIFRAFMHSASHRANIFGPWRFVGVGTEWAGHNLYVQQVFESHYDPGNVYHYP
jgi:uncharacterized protein YkwD